MNTAKSGAHRNGFPLDRALRIGAAVAAIAAALPSPRAVAQAIPVSGPAYVDFSRCTDVVIPQARSFPVVRDHPGIEVVEVHATCRSSSRPQRRRSRSRSRNPGRGRPRRCCSCRCPSGAVVSGFEFQGPGAEPTAQVLPRDEARRIYDAIVANARATRRCWSSPGYNLIRSSVFPLPAGGTAARAR